MTDDFTDFVVEVMEDEDEEDEDEDDRFFKSILNGDIENVRAMIEAGFNALTINIYGNMALHFATLNSKVDVLRLFEEQLRCKPEINTVHIQDLDSCGTALHIAMDGQVSVETVSFLLEWGADVNAIDIRGGTILHELIDMAWNDFDDNFEMEKYLSSNPQGGNSYLAKLSILKDYGVDMNKKHGLTGLTPLHKWCQQFKFVWSTEKCKDENGSIPEWCSTFFDLVLKFGSDPHIVDERGESPLFYFAQRQYKPEHKCYQIGYSSLCRKLVGVSDLAQIDNNGRTILHAAAEFSNIVLMEQLLECRITVNAKDKFRLTAVHLVTHNITDDERDFVLGMLHLLKNRGADLDAQDKHGSTPLHHAVHMKNVTAVRYLLTEGADVGIKDNAGIDVRELASFDGNQEIKYLLGILYQRTQKPIVPGISDVRVGYFYPTCCHWRNEDTTFSESPEIVSETNVQEYLENFKPCYHNRLLMIQNAIKSYESNRRQCDLSVKDSFQIAGEVLKIMEMAAFSIADENELFQCDVILGGSNAEGTKVGASDEYDFVFVLRRFHTFILPEEHADKAGLVNLKIKENVDVSLFPESFLDEDGYIKKSILSNEFHKLLERALRNKQIFEHTSFLSYAGTVNAEGECWDIGQLNLLWYGPFKKRQNVKIDIVPAIGIPQWHSKYLNPGVKILDQETLQSLGCYLVMKDVRQQVAKLKNMAVDDDDVVKMEDIMFRISFSQIEHAIIFSLPEEMKQGIKLAKSILMQVPKIGCKRMVFNEAGFCREILKTSDNHPVFVTSVFDYITSYKVKMGLLYLLNEEGFPVKINEKNLEVSLWNNVVMKDVAKTERSDCLHDAVEWSRKIYRSMVHLAKNKEGIPDFFIPLNQYEEENEDKPRGADLLTQYCEIALHFLEIFEIPSELLLSSDTQ